MFTDFTQVILQLPVMWAGAYIGCLCRSDWVGIVYVYDMGQQAVMVAN